MTGELVTLDMPEDLAAVVRQELDEGERVIWWTRPEPRTVVANRSGEWVTVIGATVLFGGLGLVVWLTARINSQLKTEPPADPVSGWFVALIFLAIPALFAVATLLNHRHLRRVAPRSFYLITNRRAVISVPAPGGHAHRSYVGGALTALRRLDRSNGTSDITFELSLSRPHSPPPRFEQGFFGIRDGVRVERLLRAIL